MSVREKLERALEKASKQFPGRVEWSDLVLAIREALAALDAEGVGLPWVSVEERRPEQGDADFRGRVLWGSYGVPTICAGFQLELSAYTHWLTLSAIRLPGQSPEPSTGLREFTCGECGASATSTVGYVRCDAPACGMQTLRADGDPVGDAHRLIAEVDAQCDEIEQTLRADEEQSMDSDLIVLPGAVVEELRKHLQQECEASGTVEGGCIAADALNRVEDILAAAKQLEDFA